jgi:DnaK suppressor protein
MFSPTDLDPASLRLQLEQRAQTLRQELQQDRSKLADDVSDPHTVLDRKDQADVAIQAGLDDAEFRRDLQELALVEAALRRLASGRFGWCEDCGQAIAPQRLAAQPWAPRCLACQARKEHSLPV